MAPRLDRLSDVYAFEPGTARLFSATTKILSGKTTDIYFVKTRDILDACGRLDAPVVAEIFAKRGGVFAGIPEVVSLLEDTGVEILSLREGDIFAPDEVVTRISGPYSAFGMYETVILGMLASSTGWATAARECVEAAGGKPVLSFGARHVHPAVSSVMERAAVVAGGCVGASCILGAKQAGIEPRGTIPHAAILIAGDTLKIAKAYDDFLPEGEPRIILVDTFHDEAEEALRIASALGGGCRPSGSTPPPRGGVTPELVREVRRRLDMAGAPRDHHRVGGLNPEDKAPVGGGRGFLRRGSYIAPRRRGT